MRPCSILFIIGFTFLTNTVDQHRPLHTGVVQLDRVDTSAMFILMLLRDLL